MDLAGFLKALIELYRLYLHMQSKAKQDQLDLKAHERIKKLRKALDENDLETVSALMSRTDG